MDEMALLHEAAREELNLFLGRIQDLVQIRLAFLIGSFVDQTLAEDIQRITVETLQRLQGYKEELFKEFICYSCFKEYHETSLCCGHSPIELALFLAGAEEWLQLRENKKKDDNERNP